jgi:hypothetical protein
MDEARQARSENGAISHLWVPCLSFPALSMMAWLPSSRSRANMFWRVRVAPIRPRVIQRRSGGLAQQAAVSFNSMLR